MPGVGESGQDVILTKEGRRVGLIQCKKYQKTLSEADCLKEIIKFALNTICDATLITNRDEFTYFLAITSKFSVDATNLMASFNRLIKENPQLEAHTNWVTKEYKASFGHLTYQLIKPELQDILARMHVKTIIPLQLDEWLHQPDYAPIVKLYFPKLQFVVPVDQLLPSRTDAELINEFNSASSDLRGWSTPFEEAGHIHLDRTETTRLLTWIREPLAPNDDERKLPSSAIFLVGGAGCGKTTILRDLWLSLHEQHVPVLGIKADRLVLQRLGDLEQELNLSIKLNDAIRQLAKSYPRIVVLIDQLDALSQSLSANREGIHIYNRLIEQVARLPHTRLVVSCRRYDLDYDPVLRQFANRPVVEVLPLSDEQVEQIVQPLGLTKPSLPPKLFKLLRVPLHLALFCEVYHAETDLATLTTLQGLYHELWTQKIMYVPASATVTTERARLLLEAMADQMYEQQRTSLPFRHYESQHRVAIDYLSSQSLITHQANKLQFFHQSFFDYVFARSFVERGGSITTNLLSTGKHQGLFIRSQIRQVLAYLREDDEERYEREVRTLLVNQRIRFHIQLLTIQHLASQANPTPVEYHLLKQVVQPHSLLWETFLEAINTANWFRFVTQAFGEQFALDDTDTYNRLYQLCRRIQFCCADDLLQLLHQLPPTAERSQFMSNVLFVLTDFSNPLALTLFNEAYAVRLEDELWFYQVMEHALTARPDWISEQLERRICSGIAQMEAGYSVKLPVERHGHNLIECLAKLHQLLPHKAFSVGLAIVKALLMKAKPLEFQQITDKLIIDTAFHHYDAEEVDHDEHYALLAKLENWLTAWLDSDSAGAMSQIDQLIASDYITLVALGLRGIAHQPARLAEVLFDKLMGSRWLEEHSWTYHDFFSEAARDALRTCFAHWTPHQQQAIAEKILATNPRQEYNHRQPESNKLFAGTGITQYELMTLLPQSFIDGYEPLKKRHQELTRKFPNYQVRERSRMRFTAGRAMSAKAYERMTDADWLNSFIQYNARSKPKWDGVDELTHAQRFENEVKQRPDRFISLLQTILVRPDIPDLYILNGLEGLAETECDPDTFKQLFSSSLTRSNEESYLTRIIRLTDFWVKRKTYDASAFDLLEHYARYGLQETRSYSEMDILNRGVNTIRGMAVHRLYQWVHEEAYTERCFQIMDQVAVDGSAAIRAVALTDQAQFDYYDRKRNLSLFTTLCEGYEIELAQLATHSLRYNIHVDFPILVPFFERWLEAPEACHIMAQLVTIAYANGYPGSEGLLEQYVVKGDEAINGVLDVALPALTDKDSDRRERCTRLAFQFLDNHSERVNQAYLGAFRQFKVADFDKLLHFLDAYAQSNVGKSRDHEFYEFLLRCVMTHPNECIRLAAYFDQHLGPDITHRYLRHEPIDVILQAYNQLEEHRHPTEEKEQAMDVFDRILQGAQYRVMLNEVYEKLY